MSKIIFFGKTYTYPVIKYCDAIDGFINYDIFSGLSKKMQADFLRQSNADTIIHVFPRRDIARAASKAGKNSGKDWHYKSNISLAYVQSACETQQKKFFFAWGAVKH